MQDLYREYVKEHAVIRYCMSIYRR